MSDKDYSAS